MRGLILFLVLLGQAGAASADYLVTTRTIRAKAIILPEDVTLQSGNVEGILTEPSEVVGMEARIAIYAGRPIRPGDLRTPAIVERNQVIPLAFRNGALSIVTEGRALERASVGETVRVMNVSSKTTVFATIARDGTAYVVKE